MTVSLPDLQDAELTDEALGSYLDELIGTKVKVQINVKGSVHTRSLHFESLAKLKEAFTRKSIHAAQLRYHYQGIDWVDTVLRKAQGARLVRMPLS